MLRFLEEDTLVGTIVSSIGTMLSIGLNLTPIILFYNFFRKNASLNTIPETMFISGIFCCATNLAYGIIQDNQILKISNGVCYGLQIFYATIYIFIKAHKQIEKLLLYLLIAWDLSFQALYIFGNILEFHFGNYFAQQFTGYTNILLGTINVITPGQNIIKVIRTGNFTLIPIWTIFAQCACSSLWLVYGLTLGDIMMIVPNLLGTVLTGLQIAVYYFFYCKNHGIPPETKEEEKADSKENQDPEYNQNPEENKLINDTKDSQ